MVRSNAIMQTRNAPTNFSPMISPREPNAAGLSCEWRNRQGGENCSPRTYGHTHTQTRRIFTVFCYARRASARFSLADNIIRRRCMRASCHFPCRGAAAMSASTRDQWEWLSWYTYSLWWILRLCFCVRSRSRKAKVAAGKKWVLRLMMRWIRVFLHWSRRATFTPFMALFLCKISWSQSGR